MSFKEYFMNNQVQRKERIQIPLEIVRFSQGKAKIGRENYSADLSGFDPFLAREMLQFGVKEGRKYLKSTGKHPGKINVYNMQSRLEVEVD